MESGSATPVTNSCPQDAGIDYEASKETVEEGRVFQQEDGTKISEDDMRGTDEEKNAVIETDGKKRKRKRKRKPRHKRTSSDVVIDLTQASGWEPIVNDDLQCSSEQHAFQDNGPAPKPPRKDRPGSAKGKSQTQPHSPQQTGQEDGRRAAGGAPNKDRPKSAQKGSHSQEQNGGQAPSRTPKGKPKPGTQLTVEGAHSSQRMGEKDGPQATAEVPKEHRQKSSEGRKHKTEQAGAQVPSQTPEGKPECNSKEKILKKERPKSGKEGKKFDSGQADPQTNKQRSTDNKTTRTTSESSTGSTNKDARSSRNRGNSPQLKGRAETQAQQNVQGGDVQTPMKSDPRDQITPGPEARGKKVKTPKSRNRKAGGTPNGKKNFKPFEDYISLEEVSHGLKKKHLLQGTLRINPKNYEEGYIDAEDGGADIMISGVTARNRALEGDVVAVELLEESTWKLLEEDYASQRRKNRKEGQPSTSAKSETVETDAKAEPGTALEKQLKNLDINDTTNEVHVDISAIDHTSAETVKGTESATAHSDNSVFRVSAAALLPSASRSANDPSQDAVRNGPEVRAPKPGSLKGEIDQVVKRLFPDGCKEDVVRGEENKKRGKKRAERREERREEIPKKFFQKHGKVVYIIERRHSRACSGLLKPPSNSNATDALFSPTDHRMPRIYIPLAECPEGFLERPSDFETTLFIARLEDWPKTSAIARGHLHRSLGEAGEIEPETEGMLIEYGVDYSDFSEEVIECLPKNLPWTIPREEIDKRRDFRDQCVFTIDPSTARDLDDALSCVPLGNGLYEVGVHIADVSFFVDEDNALDTVAGLRATSVYLVQKVIPMLPRLLCEHLCSLNPNEDKLTFSFLWKLTENGEIEDEWCGRSVIRSCVKMSYDHAQGIIAEPEREWQEKEMPPITNGFTIPDIAQGVLNLHKIAQNLRRKRSEDGALRLDQVKLQYALDKETGLPSGYSVYQQRDSNKLVEEFMLLANMAAAHRINDFNKKTALLRRHPPPKAKMIDDLVDMCSDLGLEVDGGSSKSIQESLSRYLGPRDDVEAWGRGQILTVLYSKPMQRAKYFCTGTLEDETLYRHYALNVPLYTHFTSPIRRYADILVHRQLAASLGIGPVSERDEDAIQKQAMRCNERKEAAKKVSDMSSEMFFAIFVRECGPLEEDAMVMQVLDRAVDVLVLNLGVVKRVYCNALPLKSFKFEKQGKQGRLNIVWEADEQHPDEETQILQLFSLVKVELQAGKEPLKFTASIKRPDST